MHNNLRLKRILVENRLIRFSIISSFIHCVEPTRSPYKGSGGGGDKEGREMPLLDLWRHGGLVVSGFTPRSSSVQVLAQAGDIVLGSWVLVNLMLGAT